MAITREYKDRLFKFIFGREENKKWTLSLYNAINGTSYSSPDDILINTIEDALYMGMKNDVSFLIANRMNLLEQQSVYNPNMPLRFFLYAGMLYSGYVQSKPVNIYNPYLQHIPAPRCICFYNGVEDTEERTELKLSDAFINKEKGDIEVTATMININYGKNRELLGECKPLEEYSWFVSEIRKNQKELGDLKRAVDKALEDMPDDFVIKPFLLANKAEVENMCITEYNEEETFEALRAECEARGEARGEAKGRAEGETRGVIKTLVNLFKKGLINESNAAETAGMTVEDFRRAEALYCN